MSVAGVDETYGNRPYGWGVTIKVERRPEPLDLGVDRPFDATYRRERSSAPATWPHWVSRPNSPWCPNL